MVASIKPREIATTVAPYPYPASNSPFYGYIPLQAIVRFRSLYCFAPKGVAIVGHKPSTSGGYDILATVIEQKTHKLDYAAGRKGEGMAIRFVYQLRLKLLEENRMLNVNNKRA